VSEPTEADLNEIIRHDAEMKAARADYEPLKPAPEWYATSDGSYQTHQGAPVGTIKFPPAAYEQGFEDGAFALAKKLYPLLRRAENVAAFKILHTYHEGNARPVRGWKHEPPRS
jgi:hypothetical protein